MKLKTCRDVLSCLHELWKHVHSYIRTQHATHKHMHTQTHTFIDFKGENNIQLALKLN